MVTTPSVQRDRAIQARKLAAGRQHHQGCQTSDREPIPGVEYLPPDVSEIAEMLRCRAEREEAEELEPGCAEPVTEPDDDPEEPAAELAERAATGFTPEPEPLAAAEPEPPAPEPVVTPPPRPAPEKPRRIDPFASLIIDGGR